MRILPNISVHFARTNFSRQRTHEPIISLCTIRVRSKVDIFVHFSDFEPIFQALLVDIVARNTGKKES